VAVETKICGLTRPADAALAAEAGAAYLGVVFASGPRVVTVATAREVVAAAAGRPVLGVFGRQPVGEIEAAARAAGLSGAQLHGEYSTADAVRLRDAGLVVWRVVRVRHASDADGAARLADAADLVLVEPRVAHADGGAGVALASDLAVRARVVLRGRRMGVAGGLTPETVGAAVALVSPEVVDVSSGVESQPGIKDPARIRRFLEAVVAQHAAL
jgi:phosphoribosylanthranilate isomerase